MANETEQIYKFECTAEYEKFYSDNNSFYGAYNVTVKEELPHSQLYQGFAFDKENKTYFINMAGKMQRLYVGCKYDVEAKLEFNERYNCWQYLPITIKTIKPNTLEDNQKFLKSLITEQQTESLLTIYPNIIDMIVNNEKVDLSNVKGIKDKTFNKIKDKVLKSYGISDLLILLQPLGVTLNQIEKIVQLESNVDILKKKLNDNPYILTKIKGLGFKKVDGIALKINPKTRVSKYRTIAFLNYYFESLGNQNGDTLCKINKLDSEVMNIIPECFDIYKEIIESNKERNTLLYIDGDIVGLNKYIKTEMKVLDILNTIDENSKSYKDKINVDYILEETEERLGFSLTEEQKNTVNSTLNSGVTILTAKSGAGKSTCLNGIIDIYQDTCKIGLCSLSAKASRRMTEATGKEAQTIHKMLGFGQSADKNETFLYNADNMLDYDIVLIDEASMINAGIFLSLLQAIKPTGKVVIVFDSEQLPPIGYGNIATDLLQSNFNICKLTKVHRQALESGILVDGNKVREQISPIEKPTLREIHGQLNDMCYMFRNDKTQIRDMILKQYFKWIEQDGIDNCIIIVPRKQNCINSTKEINILVQDELISKATEGINRGDVIFRKGARIIQKVNDAEKEVVNGELGYIIDIYTKLDKNDKKKQYLSIRFDDGKEIEYDRNEIGDIELGYCLTVHSTQGSEYKHVIVGIDNTHFALLSSNLLYTGMTRAKKKCLIVAEPSAFQTCIHKKVNKRRTWLRKYFRELNKIDI